MMDMRPLHQPSSTLPKPCFTWDMDRKRVSEPLHGRIALEHKIYESLISVNYGLQVKACQVFI